MLVIGFHPESRRETAKLLAEGFRGSSLSHSGLPAGSAGYRQLVFTTEVEHVDGIWDL